MDMQMDFIRKLPLPSELKEQFPIPDNVKAIKEERDNQIAEIFEGKSDKFLLIIGPCSADNKTFFCLAWTPTVQEQTNGKVLVPTRLLYLTLILQPIP